MTISARARFRVLKRDGFTCQYCGRRPPEVVLHVDHIEPRSKGGSDDPENLITSCGHCNLGKSDHQLLEVTPCCFCGEDRAGMFFVVPEVVLGVCVSGLERRMRLVCTECVREAVRVLAYELNPQLLECAGCGSFYKPREPHTLQPDDLIAGGMSWICPPCCSEIYGGYKGPAVELAAERRGV